MTDDDRAERDYPWMTEDQRRCWSVVCRAYGGRHHVNCFTKQAEPKPWGLGIRVVVRDGIATFDSDRLTRLVVRAHDGCVRLDITSSAPGLLGLELHARVRDGSMMLRHPTLEENAHRVREARR